MRNNCHCNFSLNIPEIPPPKIKPLMLEKEGRKKKQHWIGGMSGKKWQRSMVLQQLLVSYQCPNPKSLNNLHCHGRSSQ